MARQAHADRAARLIRLVETWPEQDDSMTVEEILDKRLASAPNGHETVTRWLTLAEHVDDPAPVESPTVPGCCCPEHALSRAYEWLKGDDDLTGLAARHRCP